MKLGIMQPYFFPYLGYFQLIRSVDSWVVFDVVQYMRHHWINRNRILHPNHGWQYIVVPLASHPRDALIKDMSIASQPWREKILAQFTHYKKKAPYYQKTIEFLKYCLFDVAESQTSLALMNHALLNETCRYLSVPYHATICSELGLDFSQIKKPGEWALAISQQLGADEYINPISGADIFEANEFINAKIKLTFIDPHLKEYLQSDYDCHTGLSIIDILMWNSLDEVKLMLKEYDLVSMGAGNERLA
ncbi:MAG: WbqC family protein [Geobacteraceae bacterium]|nr:WbqC family protein [Geobacteraceae bacterium]